MTRTLAFILVGCNVFSLWIFLFWVESGRKEKSLDLPDLSWHFVCGRILDDRGHPIDTGGLRNYNFDANTVTILSRRPCSQIEH